MKAVVITHSTTFEPRAEAVGKWLKAQGAEVTWIYSDFDHTHKVTMTRREADHVYLHLKPYKSNLSVQRLYNIQSFAGEVERYLKGKSFDLLYVLLPANSLARTADRLKEAGGAAVVLDIVDLWPESLPLDHVQGLPPLRLWAARRDRHLDCADRLFTECALYQELLGLPKEITRTLYWLKKEEPPRRKPEQKENDADPSGAPLELAYVGSLNYLIDQDHVAALLQALTARVPVRVHVIGEGRAYETFLERIREAGAEAVGHGAIYDEAEKAAIFSRCSFGLNFMVPQVKVGLTIKSLDYLANDLPLLNNIPGDTWELIEEYDAGVNVMRGEEETAAERILAMAADPRAADDAHRLYQEKFSAERFFETLEAHLMPLLREKGLKIREADSEAAEMPDAGSKAGVSAEEAALRREAPEVSVAMIAYNGAAYIREQLESILPQLGEEDEVLVSVDPSDDDTFTVVCEVAAEDARVRVLEGPGKGPVQNTAHVLAHCRGHYLFLADQDDVWLPGKVEKITKLLEQDTLVLHDAYLTNEALEKTGQTFMKWRRSRKGTAANLWKNSYIGCCMAFRRELLDHALPFPEDLPMHDQWLGLLAEKYGTVRLLRTPLLLYRRHEGTVTKGKHAGVTQMLRWRANIVRELARR